MYPSDETQNNVRTVKCGTAKFTLDDDVIMQYDHIGCVVGIFKVEDTPNLHAWMINHQPKYFQQGRPQFKKEDDDE